MALLSNYIRRVRIDKALPYVKGEVLDLGCGYADVLHLVPERITRYCGVDCNANNVARLQKKFPSHEFLCRDLDVDTIASDQKYDVVLLLAAIEHIYNQKHLLEQILANLKPEGKIIITTPTPWGDFVHRLASKFKLLAGTADDRHIVIYNKKRFQIVSNDFHLKMETYRRFEIGSNQFVVFSRSSRDREENER